MTSDDYLIWSHEHRAWWKAGSLGYSENISRAGVYTRDQAVRIVSDATHDWTRAPYEVAVAVADLPDQALRLLNIDGVDKAADSTQEALT